MAAGLLLTMKEIKRRSYFKDPHQDKAWLESWATELETSNKKQYVKIGVETFLGYTHVWALNPALKELPALVIFPGARTTALFWDFDNGLTPLEQHYRIYLVETNGLPNLSDGDTPDIKKDGYGHWASEVLQKLGIPKAFIAGASFGGLVCLKLSLVAPEMVQAIFLLNPGCLQPFSMAFKNLYYNLLPIIRPNRRNLQAFLNNAVLYKPFHTLSPHAEKMLIEYELFALTRYVDHTQKPYDMGAELERVSSDTYLIVGDRDILFPFEKSVTNAKRRFSSLKDIIVLPNVGHGIETYRQAIAQISILAKPNGSAGRRDNHGRYWHI